MCGGLFKGVFLLKYFSLCSVTSWHNLWTEFKAEHLPAKDHTGTLVFTFTLLKLSSAPAAMQKSLCSIYCGSFSVRNKVQWDAALLPSSWRFKLHVAKGQESAHQVAALVLGWRMHTTLSKSNDFRLVTQDCYIFHLLTEHPVLLCRTAIPVANPRVQAGGEDGRGWQWHQAIYVCEVKKLSHCKNYLHLAVIYSFEQADRDVLNCFFRFRGDKLNTDS
jgi:hypothetical protein